MSSTPRDGAGYDRGHASTVRAAQEDGSSVAWPPEPTLEKRVEEIMDRVAKAGDNHAERAAASEEYLALARTHEGEAWFEAGAYSEDLAEAYLVLGRFDDAVRTIRHATRWATPRVRRCCVSWPRS